MVPATEVGVSVLVRYFAAARAAAGVDEEKVRLTGPASLTDLRHEIAERHDQALAEVLARCSFLLNEIVVHNAETSLRDGDAVDVLPPFAGG